MASEDNTQGADEALTLDEVAPRRRSGEPSGRGSAGSSRRKVLAGLVVIALVGIGATVAAVAGPAPDGDVGQGVAVVAEVGATATTAPTSVPVPTTAAPTPETTIAPEVGANDCGDAEMCGDIASDGPCDDAGMCGEIRADDECTDGEMCGEIPVPSECGDPAMCGDIVPEPVGPGG